jgi:serine/threonine protein kinase
MADDLIRRFTEMLMPILSVATPAASKSFQQKLMNILQIRKMNEKPEQENNIYLFLKGIYSQIPDAGPNALIKTGKKGTYGEVFTVAGKDTIIKKINFFQGTDIASYRYFFAILKELLVQFILSNDRELGNHIPKLFSIKKSGTHNILVEMEKADYTFRDWLYDMIAREGQLNFASVKPRIKDIFGILIKLHKKYRFTHRDFKLDNVMYSGVGDNAVVKIIDFGMSCISITFNGRSIRIINDVYYSGTSTCKIEQDIGLFLFNFLYEMSQNLDQEFSRFLTDAGVKNFEKHLAAIPSQLSVFHRAYNKNGAMFSGAPISSLFKPAQIMQLLEALQLKTAAYAVARRNTRSKGLRNNNTRKVNRGVY